MYSLYKENNCLQSLTGNGGPLRLTAPAASGYYRIVATYSEGGLSDSAELEGIRYNSDMLSLDDDRNWILTPRRSESLTTSVITTDWDMHCKMYKFTPAATDSRTSCSRSPTMACIVRNSDICLMFAITIAGDATMRRYCIRRISTERNMNWERCLLMPMSAPNTSLRY